MTYYTYIALTGIGIGISFHPKSYLGIFLVHFWGIFDPKPYLEKTEYSSNLEGIGFPKCVLKHSGLSIYKNNNGQILKKLLYLKVKRLS